MIFCEKFLQKIKISLRRDVEKLISRKRYFCLFVCLCVFISAIKLPRIPTYYLKISFSIFFLPPPGVVSEDFFLIQLICRKKIKKEIFLQVFFSIFAGHFLPLFVHLSKQQKKQNLIWILLYKEFFLFQQSHKTSFWKTNTQLFLRDIFLLHYKHQIHSIQKYLHCH